MWVQYSFISIRCKQIKSFIPTKCYVIFNLCNWHCHTLTGTAYLLYNIPPAIKGLRQWRMKNFREYTCDIHAITYSVQTERHQPSRPRSPTMPIPFGFPKTNVWLVSPTSFSHFKHTARRTNSESIPYTLFSNFLLLPPSCVTIFTSAFCFQSVLQLAYELTYSGKQSLTFLASLPRQCRLWNPGQHAIQPTLWVLFSTRKTATEWS
jgi:hypothetical protein